MWGFPKRRRRLGSRPCVLPVRTFTDTTLWGIQILPIQVSTPCSTLGPDSLFLDVSITSLVPLFHLRLTFLESDEAARTVAEVTRKVKIGREADTLYLQIK